MTMICGLAFRALVMFGLTLRPRLSPLMALRLLTRQEVGSFFYSQSTSEIVGALLVGVPVLVLMTLTICQSKLGENQSVAQEYLQVKISFAMKQVLKKSSVNRDP